MKGKLAMTRNAVLIIAGMLLILVAASIIVAPVDFYAANEIEIGADISLINELKAPAGMLLVAGAFMLVAVFVRNLVDTAMLLGAMVYLSYAASRFASMWFDGMPAPGLVQAASIEAVFGLACLATLLARRFPGWRAV